MSLNVITVKLFCISKNQLLKNLCSGTHRTVGWGISILAAFRPMEYLKSFRAEVVFGVGKKLKLKSVLGHCVRLLLWFFVRKKTKFLFNCKTLAQPTPSDSFKKVIIE